jgi:opacity protein-like surface antigen
MNDSSPQGAALAHSRHGALVELRRHCRLPIIVFAAAMLLISTAIFPALSARAQSNTTASRIGNLQIGAGFVFAKSNYNFTPINLFGGSLYTTFDIRNHWGGEFNFRHTRASSDSTVYERTYEIGPRIFIARGPLIPYAKVLYGRGVYNFHNNIANIAFNMYTFGGGADFQLRRSINLRADYEYQTWMGFPITNLHPSVITIGVAYHFHE